MCKQFMEIYALLTFYIFSTLQYKNAPKCILGYLHASVISICSEMSARSQVIFCFLRNYETNS